VGGSSHHIFLYVPYGPVERAQFSLQLVNGDVPILNLQLEIFNFSILSVNRFLQLVEPRSNALRLCPFLLRRLAVFSGIMSSPRATPTAIPTINATQIRFFIRFRLD